MTGSIKGLYDDDRSIKVEPTINGELLVKVGGQKSICVPAEQFRVLVEDAARGSLAALAYCPDDEIEWNPVNDVWRRATVVVVEGNALLIQLVENGQRLNVARRHVRPVQSSVGVVS